MYYCHYGTVALVFFSFVLNLAFRSNRRPIFSRCEVAIGKRGVVSTSEDWLWLRIEGERWRCKKQRTREDDDDEVIASV